MISQQQVKLFEKVILICYIEIDSYFIDIFIYKIRFVILFIIYILNFILVIVYSLKKKKLPK